MPGVSVQTQFPDLNKDTIYGLYTLFRNLRIPYFEKHPIVFGSNSNLSAEIQLDESLLGKACKYNKGKPFPRYWIFGLLDPAAQMCKLSIVPDRTKKTLLPSIQKHVPNTDNQDQIISDGWKPYEDIPKLGYKHSTVIHKEEFVTADGKNTNSVESVWSQLKCWFRSMHGVVSHKFDGYLREFEFR